MNDPIGKGKRGALFYHSGGNKTLLSLSKAAWQDIAWNLAARCAERDDAETIRKVLIEEAGITTNYRKHTQVKG